jgi:hypothetical protein
MGVGPARLPPIPTFPRTGGRGCTVATPHPNPLPEGEGARSAPCGVERRGEVALTCQARLPIVGGASAIHVWAYYGMAPAVEAVGIHVRGETCV